MMMTHFPLSSPSGLQMKGSQSFLIVSLAIGFHVVNTIVSGRTDSGRERKTDRFENFNIHHCGGIPGFAS
jgi:hypothetical protein